MPTIDIRAAIGEDDPYERVPLERESAFRQVCTAHMLLVTDDCKREHCIADERLWLSR